MFVRAIGVAAFALVLAIDAATAWLHLGAWWLARGPGASRRWAR